MKYPDLMQINALKGRGGGIDGARGCWKYQSINTRQNFIQMRL